jgi:hypothetical protein
MSLKSSRGLEIKSVAHARVNNVSASGTGWGDTAKPPNMPDWASQQVTAHIDGAAYVLRADVAPGAFAAMTALLVAAAQHRHFVNILWFQPAEQNATPVLTAVQIENFAETW